MIDIKTQLTSHGQYIEHLRKKLSASLAADDKMNAAVYAEAIIKEYQSIAALLRG